MLLEGDEPVEDADKRQGDEDDVSEGHGDGPKKNPPCEGGLCCFGFQIRLWI